jgi:DNA-binding transcriptional regulator YhcF (GntR family)
MADFTETPHAEDFAMELGDLYDNEIDDLITEYRGRGLSKEWIKTILKDTFNWDELLDEDEE